MAFSPFLIFLSSDVERQAKETPCFVVVHTGWSEALLAEREASLMLEPELLEGCASSWLSSLGMSSSVSGS